MKNNFSNNLAYIIKSLKMSQDEFGLIFGLKKGVINQYLLGKSTPKLETIQKIAFAFGLTIDSLLNAEIKDGYERYHKNPELNLERLTLTEQVFFNDVITKKDEENELIKAKDDIIDLLKFKNKTLQEKLEDCENEKKRIKTIS